jgi:hypothetical protein
MAGEDGADGTSAPAADSSSADDEPHVHINGRDLGTLSAALSYCESVQIDIANAGPLPSVGGNVQYPNANENRTNCGYSNGDLQKFLDDRRAIGDYSDFVY